MSVHFYSLVQGNIEACNRDLVNVLTLRSPELVIWMVGPCYMVTKSDVVVSVGMAVVIVFENCIGAVALGDGPTILIFLQEKSILK